jgi:hypothetical protein
MRALPNSPEHSTTAIDRHRREAGVETPREKFCGVGRVGSASVPTRGAYPAYVSTADEPTTQKDRAPYPESFDRSASDNS